MNILVVADQKYSKFIKPFANSLLNSGTKFNKLFVGQIGFYEQPIHYDRVEFLPQNLGQNSPAICANIRAEIMHNIIDLTTEDLLYIDVDSLVVGDLEGINDFAGCARFHHRPWNPQNKMRVASGVVYVRNSREGKMFLSKWAQYVTKFGIDKWFSDQEALYKTSLECQVADLDRKYIDWDFKDDSCIWTGKGKRKYKNEKYTKAVKQWAL